MKTTIMIEQEVDIKTVSVALPCRYGDEDIPFDFPLRDGDMWNANIDIDTGVIADWPKGKSGDMFMKICDTGKYELFDVDGKSVALLDDGYVPNNLIPGEYGDYVDFKIDESGTITNWTSSSDFSDFNLGS